MPPASELYAPRLNDRGHFFCLFKSENVILSRMKATYVYVLLVIALIAGLIFVRNNTERADRVTALDPFVQCLADAGATFYGAFWCPHCQEQKKILQNSAKINDVYVECSTADMKGQTPICIEKGIESYPAWEFADGSRANGEQTLEQLAEKTGCVLPQATS
jgi:thiol-disulfide isomerase/thioredoxin